MGFDDRLLWWLIGCLIGFVCGYIVRSLHEIKEELDDMDQSIKHNREEGGFVRHPVVMDIALLVVVVLTVWAAFASQRASHDVQETQSDITRITVCNQQYLSRTIKALNERTTYTQEQVRSNVELQQAQLELLQVGFQKPPATRIEGREALKRYFDRLETFVLVSTKSSQKVDDYPFPTNAELRDCLDPQ